MPETESTRNFDLEKSHRGVTKCQITSLLAHPQAGLHLGSGTAQRARVVFQIVFQVSVFKKMRPGNHENVNKKSDWGRAAREKGTFSQDSKKW